MVNKWTTIIINGNHIINNELIKIIQYWIFKFQNTNHFIDRYTYYIDNWTKVVMAVIS